MDYDVLVIGTGPAGEGAAMMATKHGKRTGIVEMSKIGGSCTHKGTIPSKALRHSVKQIMLFNKNKFFRTLGEPKWPSFPEVLASSKQVIEKQMEMRAGFYHRNRVKVHFGKARFVDPNTVEIADKHGAIEKLTAENIVIATGSSPYLPNDVDFSHNRIYSSDSILSLSHTPRSIIIYGAGVIGCEYASIFSGLGVKVDLINNREKLLSFMDDAISDALSYHLRENGVLMRHNENYEKVEGRDQDVVLHLESGKKLRADAFLWCNGRTGNTRDLGLEYVGLETNSRGQIQVDNHYKTEVENIYAAGDVIGWPSLASAAYDQGRSVSSDLIAGAEFRFIDSVPTGIYTIPEISSLGATEAELTEKRIPYEVGEAFFNTLARAQITGETTGMLKILFHRETLEVLGIHCFGDQAAEIIHIGQIVMNQEGSANNLNAFINNTFNYPTMAEAYRVAAINGMNRVFE